MVYRLVFESGTSVQCQRAQRVMSREWAKMGDDKFTKIELYDTTLRDGNQQRGINLSVENKLAIAHALDELGVDYIEGGYAGANPVDDKFFEVCKNTQFQKSTICAFGNTRRAGVSVQKDGVVKALERSEATVITLVGKASEYQVKNILETELLENLDMVTETTGHFLELKRRVFFDAEHFFDGWKQSKKYALAVLEAAHKAGAERIILCDTNGGTLPSEIGRIVKEVSGLLDAKLGIHAHNDCGTAVANSLVALEQGAIQVQGCVNGYGERTGNANLLSIVANLKLKLGFDCVSGDQLKSLYRVGHQVAEIVNIKLGAGEPYIGANAFAHKGGLHASAVRKESKSYEHINPELVGNHNAITISDLAGGSSMRYYLDKFELTDKLGKEKSLDLIKLVKKRESLGYAYENSLASLELLALRGVSTYKPPYELLDFKIISHNSGATQANEATIKLAIGGQTRLVAGEGNGPLSALNDATKKILFDFYPFLDAIYLADYKVRVIDENLGTESMVRALIESSDGTTRWGTVGSAENVIEASWQALSDSYEWYIYKHI